MAKSLTTVLNELSSSYTPHIKSRYTIDFEFPFLNQGNAMSLVLAYKSYFTNIYAISLDLPGYDAGFEQINAGRNLNVVLGARPSDINPFQGFKFTFINDKYMSTRSAFTYWYYSVKIAAPQPTRGVPIECYANATIKMYDEKNRPSAILKATNLLVDVIEPTQLAWSSQEEYSVTTVKMHNIGDMVIL